MILVHVFFFLGGWGEGYIVLLRMIDTYFQGCGHMDANRQITHRHQKHQNILLDNTTSNAINLKSCVPLSESPYLGTLLQLRSSLSDNEQKQMNYYKNIREQNLQ